MFDIRGLERESKLYLRYHQERFIMHYYALPSLIQNSGGLYLHLKAAQSFHLKGRDKS